MNLPSSSIHLRAFFTLLIFFWEMNCYVNPIHPTITSGQQSNFTAIGSAVLLQASSFLSPKRKRVPQETFIPKSKWGSSMGRTNTHMPITFDLIGYHGQGVSMRELTARGLHALSALIVGAQDHVLIPTGLQRISFRICWPGYPQVNWTRSIETYTPHGPMTRAQLGAAIAMNFARFIEKAQYEPSGSPAWVVGFSGIRLEQLVLVSLWNVSEDSWQAEVAVDF